MSLWVDIEYANMLSMYVERYKVKARNPFVANFRCPICLDSSKKKSKARGYLFVKPAGLFYKCHNCDAGMSVGNLLESIDPNLAKEYRVAKFKESRSRSFEDKPQEYKKPPPNFKNKRLIDDMIDRVSSLPEDHPAQLYCSKRKIPKNKLSSIYYIDDISKIGNLSDKYKEQIVGKEPRLILPVYNREHKLIALICRAIREGDKLRYVNIKIVEDVPYLFNIDNLDFEKEIYILEGPIDSLFVPNSVGVSSLDFRKIKGIIPDSCSITVIVDNQPRNKDVIKQMNSACDRGNKVFIWPTELDDCKDVNDVFMNRDITKEEFIDTINHNSFSGLELKLKIAKWSKLNSF